MKQTQLEQPMSFKEVQAFLGCGKTWGTSFPATECARILGYSNPYKAIHDHCRGLTKREVLTNGGVQEKTYISELGCIPRYRGT